jgi:hypothetical protein
MLFINLFEDFNQQKCSNRKEINSFRADKEKRESLHHGWTLRSKKLILGVSIRATW